MLIFYLIFLFLFPLADDVDWDAQYGIQAENRMLNVEDYFAELGAAGLAASCSGNSCPNRLHPQKC